MNEMNISILLKRLGITPGVLGFHYIKEAIILVMKNTSFKYALVGELYTKIAVKFHTTPARVERAIRHAIEKAWYIGNTDLQQKLFGHTVSSEKGKPTNGELIATVAEYLLCLEKGDNNE